MSRKYKDVSIVTLLNRYQASSVRKISLESTSPPSGIMALVTAKNSGVQWKKLSLSLSDANDNIGWV